MGERGLAGLFQGDAERVPGFRAFRRDPTAAEQQWLRTERITTGDEQSGKREQRFLATWIEFKYFRVGFLSRPVVTMGAEAFGQP
jgi:hypothetical protein